MSRRLSSSLHITCSTLTNNLSISTYSGVFFLFSCILPLPESLSLLTWRGGIVFFKGGEKTRPASSQCETCYDRLVTPPLALDGPGDVSLQRQRPGGQEQDHGGLQRRQLRGQPVPESAGASDLVGPQRHLRGERGAGLRGGGAREAVQPLLRHPELPERLFALRIFRRWLLPVQSVPRWRERLRATVRLRREICGVFGPRWGVLLPSQGIRLLSGLFIRPLSAQLPGRSRGACAECAIWAQARASATHGALPALDPHQRLERPGLLRQGAAAVKPSVEVLLTRYFCVEMFD